MSPRRQRLLFLAFSVMFISAAVLLTLRAFKENIVFFYTPSMLADKPSPPARLRVGGLVENGSLTRVGDDVAFTLTDGSASLRVHYKGLLPSLFREGQGVVAEGRLQAGELNAERVLAKHDETYMPKEVAEALKRSGYWKGGGAANSGYAAPAHTP